MVITSDFKSKLDLLSNEFGKHINYTIWSFMKSEINKKLMNVMIPISMNCVLAKASYSRQKLAFFMKNFNSLIILSKVVEFSELNVRQTDISHIDSK